MTDVSEEAMVVVVVVVDEDQDEDTPVRRDYGCHYRPADTVVEWIPIDRSGGFGVCQNNNNKEVTSYCVAPTKRTNT